MNKITLKEISELRKATKKARAPLQGREARVNRYRFAWWLIGKYPNLAVAIVQEYIKQLEAVDGK